MKRINFYEVSLVLMIIGSLMIIYGNQFYGTSGADKVIGYWLLGSFVVFLSLIFRLFPAPTKKHSIDIVLFVVISAIPLIPGYGIFLSMMWEIIVPIVAIYLLIKSRKEGSRLNT